MSYQMSLKEKVISYTKETGILPCIKLHHKDDYIAYAQAMYDGGASRTPSDSACKFCRMKGSCGVCYI